MSRPNRIRARHYRNNEVVEVTFHEGTIAHIHTVDSQPEEKLPWVGPGLVDLQINGYLGLDFNEFPMEPERVIEATNAMWKEGVTAYYPTVTTNSDDKIETAMRSIAQACEADEHCARGIAGIHVEGPFISPEDGARGAHSSAYTKAPDWELFQRWQEAANGRIRILTLSPEWPEAVRFIERCTASGVTVSIGHTAATPEQIRAAVAAGARMSTHFGNGAHLQLPRHPNYLWEQLAQDDLWSCVIADGFHLPDQVLKVVLKVKGPKAMLVSDAIHLSGLAPGPYYSHGRIHVVKTEEGRVHLRDEPRLLAGSGQMLPWGISHMARNGICGMPEAWDMASKGPAAFMNLPSRQGLQEGAPADLVLFDWDGSQIRILQTYKDGREMPIA